MFFSLIKEINRLISKGLSNIYLKVTIKGTVMQIEKALINDRLCVSKVS